MPRSFRALALAFLVLASLGFLPAAATASNLNVTVSVGNDLTITDSDDGAHDLDVIHTGNTWRITDAAAGATVAANDLASGTQCVQVDDFTLDCTQPGGSPYDEVRVISGDASDVLDLRFADLPTWIEGQGGIDTITGGDDNDMVFGGVGNDTIDGRLGVDNLSGEIGADSCTAVLEMTCSTL